MLWLLLALIISVLALIFAVQNTAPVSVSFLIWQTESALTIVVLIALGVGAVVSLLTTLPSHIRGRWSSYSKGRRITDIEAELTRTQADLLQAHERILQLEAGNSHARDEEQSHHSGSS